MYLEIPSTALDQWAARLRGELAKVEVTEKLTERQAAKAAAAVWEAVGEDVRSYLATRLLKEANVKRTEREGRERAEQRREQRRAEIERGRRALEKLYGGRIASEIDLRAEYRIAEVWGVTIAARADRIEELANREPTLKVSGGQVLGYRLGTLAQGVDAVAGDDLEPALELIRERRARRQSDERQQAAAAAQRAQRERDRREQERTYGTVLD